MIGTLNCGGHADHVTGSVYENRINSFKNLLLQTHQSDCYQIWVTTLGQGPDKLPVQWSYFCYVVPCIVVLIHRCGDVMITDSKEETMDQNKGCTYSVLE